MKGASDLLLALSGEAWRRVSNINLKNHGPSGMMPCSLRIRATDDPGAIQIDGHHHARMGRGQLCPRVQWPNQVLADMAVRAPDRHFISHPDDPAVSYDPRRLTLNLADLILVVHRPANSPD